MDNGEPRPVLTGSWMDRVKGVVYGGVILTSALLGCVYLLVPLLPLMLIAPKVYRGVIDTLVGWWLIMPTTIVEWLWGVRVTVSGDVVVDDQPAIILMNHRTRLDWLFFWSALYRISPRLVCSEKISLKGILRFVPGAGWAMAANAFIFLHRAFARDQEKMKRMLQYYARCGRKYQLLLFPEGTDKCDKATERSRLYAEKKDLVHYQYVLHPKTTGFVFILQNMRNERYVKYVYDVTVAFTAGLVQSEIALITHGICPKHVHYHIRKIDVEELPQGDGQLSKWLIELWEKKEEQLREFYMNGRAFDKSTQFQLSPYTSALRVGSVIFWLIATLCWLLICITFPYQLQYAIFCFAIFMLAHLRGGLEWIAVDAFNRRFPPSA